MLGVGEVVDDHLVLEDVEAVRLQNHHATEVDGKEDENPVEKDKAVIFVKERRGGNQRGLFSVRTARDDEKDDSDRSCNEGEGP